MFLSSNRGRRILNVMYSWGAAVVIIGALFKLLHLPFGNQMLFIGMMTEFFVFFISGFEKPLTEYRWEDVFPQLDSTNPMDREEMEARRVYLSKKAEEAAARAAAGIETSLDPVLPPTAAPHHVAPQTQTVSEGTFTQPQADLATQTVASSYSEILPEEELTRLKDGIGKLTDATEQLARIGQLSQNMAERFDQLLQVQDSSIEYGRQMNDLSRNIAGLNTIYEIQLKGISSQIDSIEHINMGLQRIRDMYESTVIDSSSFRMENERMARQLTDINAVYARILGALTVNMNAPAPTHTPNWPSQQPNPYSSHTAYGQQPSNSPIDGQEPRSI